MLTAVGQRLCPYYGGTVSLIWRVCSERFHCILMDVIPAVVVTVVGV